MDSSTFTSHLRPSKRTTLDASSSESAPERINSSGSRRRSSSHRSIDNKNDCETASLKDEEMEKVDDEDEEALMLLEIQKLNTIPDSLGRYSIRATTFHFAQAAILFYFASKSDTQWKWFTNYPDASEGANALNAPPQMPHSNEVASFSILWYSPIFICT